MSDHRLSSIDGCESLDGLWFLYMLELLMMVLKQYEFFSLIIVFHFYFALILLAATMTSLILWSCFYCSSSNEYEGGDYENAEIADDDSAAASVAVPTRTYPLANEAPAAAVVAVAVPTRTDPPVDEADG